MADRLGVRKKVSDCFSVVSFAVREAALIEAPTFVEIAVPHRHHNGLRRSSHHRLNQAFFFSPLRPHFNARFDKGLLLNCPIMMVTSTCTRESIHYTSSNRFVQHLILDGGVIVETATTAPGHQVPQRSTKAYTSQRLFF